MPFLYVFHKQKFKVVSFILRNQFGDMFNFRDFKKIYKEDSEFAVQIRMMTALSFIPINDVQQIFDDLLDTKYLLH